MTARPIITMDDADESLWMVNPDDPAKPVYLGCTDGGSAFLPAKRREFSFAEIRAIADFLTQLAGANLLSGVGDEDDE